MEIKGKIVKILKAESGESKAGNPWRSQTCIIETGEEYNNQVALRFMGDNISKLKNLNEGDTVTASCNVYSREAKGRFFNNIDCWKIVLENAKQLSGSDFVTTEDDPF
jgi:hypothetical protein